MNIADPKEVLPLCVEHAKKLGIAPYLVGGIVRDAVVLAKGEDSHVHDFDFDIVCEGDAILLAKEVASKVEGSELKTHEAFITAKLTLSSGAHIDFVTARTEVYPVPGALPVVTPAPLSKDLYRRDFTVNAMAVTLEDFLSTKTPTIIDPFEGRKALLEEKKLSVLHQGSFVDDPTRIFRAARYASRFALALDGMTAEALRIAVCGAALRTISNIRVLNELKRIADEPVPSAALQVLEHYGVLKEISLFTPAMRNSLHELSMRLNSDDFCIWLYRNHDKSSREEVFSAYGFGKKFFKVAQ
jgi:tRNA nucleotidyltransferase (CCA-adding enzyme)